MSIFLHIILEAQYRQHCVERLFVTIDGTICFFPSIDSINQREWLTLNQHELLSDIIKDPNH